MEFGPKLLAALQAVVDAEGSDLVLTIGSYPLIRVDGNIGPNTSLPVVDEAMMHEVLAQLLDPAQRTDFVRDRDIDFAFSFGQYRLRGNAFFQRNRPTLSLRLLYPRIPTFDEIGLPESVRELTNLKQGLVLFTGPTGCGKSTSLASLIEAINETRPCHILTIEDPIEFLHDNRVAVVHQREV